MVETFGVVIALYVLTRIVSSDFKKARALLMAITAMSAAYAIFDVGYRYVTGNTLIPAISPGKDTSSAQDGRTSAPVATVSRDDGGSISTPLKYGIEVAKGSSLRREWIAVHHADLPVDIEGTPGVTTVYESDNYRGNYKYNAEFSLTVSQSISAIDVRFLIFNVWGEHVRTLNYQSVKDLHQGTHRFVGEWNVHSENEVEQHYASIAYVARARMSDGTTLSADISPVLEEARKFSAKFAPSQLETTPAQPAGGS